MNKLANLSGCLGLAFGIILIYALANLFVGWLFMSLWNWLLPLIWIAAPIFTFWQALGIVMLLTIIGSLFKSNSKQHTY